MKIGKGINWRFIAGVAVGITAIGLVAGILEVGAMAAGTAMIPTHRAVHRGYYAMR
jgi:hypothetical protein